MCLVPIIERSTRECFFFVGPVCKASAPNAAHCHGMSRLVRLDGRGSEYLGSKKHFWLVVYLTIWKIWVRQLGWWNSQYDGKNEKFMFQTTNQVSSIRSRGLMTGWFGVHFRKPPKLNFHLPHKGQLSIRCGPPRCTIWVCPKMQYQTPVVW